MDAQQTPHRKKRKRYTDKPSSKFQTKLHHGVKEAKKAAKLAKAFEVQKLVKRLKGLREKSAPGNEIRDAEAQLSVMKAVDCESFAALALYRKLRRDKHIMSNADASAAMADELPSMSTVAPVEPKPKTAEAIVESRLASSKLLAKELHGVVAGLRALVLGPSESTDNEGGSREPGYDNELTAVDQLEEEESIDGSGESDDSAANADNSEWESGSISQDDNSDSDDSADFRSEAERPPTKRRKVSIPPKAHVDATGPIVKEKPDPKLSHPSLKDDSVFLPSLTVGFTKGDSDISGDDLDSDAGSVDPVRKNRRGQRARQQIWEKKYGKNANHVKKQKEEEVKENVAAAYESRGRRRGAASGRGRGATNSRGRGRGRGASGPAGGPTALTTFAEQTQSASVSSNKKEGSQMHPSWEAAKKRKEQVMVVPFQGKKIVF